MKKDVSLEWLKGERNLLQNTGGLMIQDRILQIKVLHIADCLNMTIKYIEGFQKIDPKRKKIKQS